MKHSLKKVLSLIVTLAMALTVFSAFSIAVAAEEYVDVGGNDRTVFDKSGAKKMKSGETYKGNSGQTALSWYKITPSKSGTLKIDYTTKGGDTNLYLLDKNGDYVNRSNISIYNGSLYDTGTHHIIAYPDNKKFSAQLTFKVKKETYYLVICPGWQDLSNGGEFTLKATFPSETVQEDTSNVSGTTGDILYLSTAIEEGDTLKLTAVTASSSSKVTYSSSDKSIVSVDSNGKIKAKKAGTAYVTIKSGKTVIKIKVTVIGD